MSVSVQVHGWVDELHFCVHCGTAYLHLSYNLARGVRTAFWNLSNRMSDLTVTCHAKPNKSPDFYLYYKLHTKMACRPRHAYHHNHPSATQIRPTTMTADIDFVDSKPSDRKSDRNRWLWRAMSRICTFYDKKHAARPPGRNFDRPSSYQRIPWCLCVCVRRP